MDSSLVGRSSSASIWRNNVDEKERRKRLASLPFSEKLKALEKLRDRSRAIAAAGLRKSATRAAAR
jgi:hypothetical protein